MLRSRIAPATLVLAAFIGLAVGVAVVVIRTHPFGVVLKDGQPDRLMDFASHRGFACAAWAGDLADDGSSIYSVQAHLRATERWSGFPARMALPFGYSPTMLWAMAPFCAVPQRVAFVGWTLAGVLATIATLRRARASAMTLVPLLTPLTVAVIALGQTAILTTAGLLFLMTEPARRAPARSALVLWLLGAKPPVAIAAGAALIAGRRWRVLGIAAALTAVSTVVVAPWMGATWLRDYADLVVHYDRAHLPAAFGWSIVPELMTNVRAALAVDLGIGDGVASGMSSVLWAVALAGIAVAGIAGRLTSPFLWGATILGYLLLCPHVSATEDVALVCVVVALERGGVPRRLRIAVLGLVMAALLLSPLVGAAAGRRPPIAFFAKAAMAVLLLRGVDVGAVAVRGAGDGEVPVRDTFDTPGDGNTRSAASRPGVR